MKVFRWGNDLVVPLPKTLVDEMGLVEGDELEIVEIVGRMVHVQKGKRRAEALNNMAGRALAAAAVDRFERDEANER